MNITNDKQKRVLLLYQAGEEIFEILPGTGEEETILQHKPNWTHSFPPRK